MTRILAAFRSMSYLVVLVRTHSPGNLGSAARAAKAFGATLTLLDPHADRGHDDARAFASGASDTLDAAQVVTSLDALDADLLVAVTSLRGRKVQGLPPAIAWPALRRAGRAALIFGPERAGLTTDEVHRCHARLSLPTRPGFPTLNMGQAVAAVLAVLASGRVAASVSSRAGGPQLDRLLTAFAGTLQGAGYPGTGHSADVLHELTSWILRSRPTEREVTLLLGALSALKKSL